ncbi:MAG TPA: zf-HC2 domain-containing protein [Ktedonobacteraceae bacterium]|nr:zf-HC2 domain-containing protein [Ktedonobacteraceae bacterium]
MSQTQNEHLTTEQLSASLDKQLSSQEQAVFDAHIVSCQQCQHKLADLRLTATLLHALPVEEVPRSFMLPTSVSITPDRTTSQKATITPLPVRQRKQSTALHRSIRIISALAAVLALCFIISGMLPLLYSGAGSSTSTSSGSTTLAPERPNATASGAEQPKRVLQKGEATANAQATATGQARTPTSTATPASNSNHASNPNTGTIIQPAIDLSQPGVRLGIGIVVLALSIIVLILTRRRRVATH